MSKRERGKDTKQKLRKMWENRAQGVKLVLKMEILMGFSLRESASAVPSNFKAPSVLREQKLKSGRNSCLSSEFDHHTYYSILNNPNQKPTHHSCSVFLNLDISLLIYTSPHSLTTSLNTTTSFVQINSHLHIPP